jgi:hypothetical protein
MKDTSTALKTAFAQEVVTVASLWKIERTDGTVLAFTDHITDIEYDSNTYIASSGFSRTALQSQEGLSVDNMDVTGILDSENITKQDLVAGKYLNAQVWICEVDYTDISKGIQKLEYGVIGRITIKEDIFIAEIRSLTSLLSLEIGQKYTRYCPHRLGSSEIKRGVETKCGIELDPADWTAETEVELGDVVSPTTANGYRYVCTAAGTTDTTEPTWGTTLSGTTTETTSVEWTAYDAYTYYGTIDTLVDKQRFADSTLIKPENYFRAGTLLFTSGNNNGFETQVKLNAPAGGTIELMIPAPFTIEIGDTFKMVVGCNHLLKVADGGYTGDCKTKFNLENGGNAENFGGYCEIPGNEAALNIV